MGVYTYTRIRRSGCTIQNWQCNWISKRWAVGAASDWLGEHVVINYGINAKQACFKSGLPFARVIQGHDDYATQEICLHMIRRSSWPDKESPTRIIMRGPRATQGTSPHFKSGVVLLVWKSSFNQKTLFLFIYCEREVRIRNLWCYMHDIFSFSRHKLRKNIASRKSQNYLSKLISHVNETASTIIKRSIGQNLG